MKKVQGPSGAKQSILNNEVFSMENFSIESPPRDFQQRCQKIRSWANLTAEQVLTREKLVTLKVSYNWSKNDLLRHYCDALIIEHLIAQAETHRFLFLYSHHCSALFLSAIVRSLNNFHRYSQHSYITQLAL